MAASQLRRWYRAVSVTLGVFGVISLAMLVIDSSSTAVNVFPDGVWERAAVYAVIVWELVTGGRLLNGHHPLDLSDLSSAATSCES